MPEPARVRRSRTFSDYLPRTQCLSAQMDVSRLREASKVTDLVLTGFPSPPPSDVDEFNSPIRPSIGNNPGIGIHSPPDSESGELPSLVHECRQADVFSPCSFSQLSAEVESTAELPPSKKSDSFPFPIEPTVHPDSSPNRALTDWKAAILHHRSVSTGKNSTPKTADRYIADRDGSQSPFETFRLSKPTHKLSVTEKFLRQKSATPDPFAPSRAARVQGRALPSLDARNGNRIRPLGVSGTDVLSVPRNGLSIESRAASSGAVWNVGGNTAATSLGPVQSISDGRGGFLGSGTNAPMYRSNFLEGRLSEQEDDYFEGRLAAALDIDQIRRMYNSSQAPEYGRRVGSIPDKTKRKPSYRDFETKWKDGEWVREGSPLGE